MQKYSLRKLSFIGFAALIAGFLFSFLSLVYFIRNYEEIRQEEIALLNSYNSALRLKNATASILTSYNLERDASRWNTAVIDFDEKINNLKRDQEARDDKHYELIIRYWSPSIEEIHRIRERLKDPEFLPSQSMDRPILRRLGESFRSSSEAGTYIVLNDMAKSVDTLSQYEGFILDEFKDLIELHRAQEDEELGLFKELSLLIPLTVFIVAVLFSGGVGVWAGRVERELERLNNQLHNEVERQITEIRDRDRMLVQQAKHVAMGEMLGNLAHQWRQPLNALGLYIQDLHESYLSGEAEGALIQESTDKSLQIIQHLSQTIDDFSNFFKQDDDGIQVMNLSEIIKEIRRLTLDQLNSKSVDLIFDDSRVLAMGYPGELKQVLLHLIGNSRDAIVLRAKMTPGLRGWIRIIVSSREDEAMIVIEDNGGGIPDVLLDKLFDPYFTTKFKAQGTGIGLFMSKILVEQHMKGSLIAENTEQGLRVSVHLRKANQ